MGREASASQERFARPAKGGRVSASRISPPAPGCGSPDPASLGPRTKGKTNIGCIFTGKKDGKEKTYYIYNVCDHQECYKEVGSQAISYTTGVPAMCGALMLLTGKWTTKGVHTVEEFDPDPYLDALDKYGLPRSESHAPALVD